MTKLISSVVRVCIAIRTSSLLKKGGESEYDEQWWTFTRPPTARSNLLKDRVGWAIQLAQILVQEVRHACSALQCKV